MSLSSFAQPTVVDQMKSELYLLLQQWDEHLTALNHVSSDAFQRFKNNFCDKLHEWQQTASRTHNHIAILPTIIPPEDTHQGKVVDKLKSSLHNFELALQSCQTQLSEKYSLHQSLHDLSSYFHGLKEHAGHFIDQFQVETIQDSLQRAYDSGRILARRTQLQWGRKLFHTASGVFGLWLYGYSGMSETAVIIVVSLCLALGGVTEIIRRASPSVNQNICRIFKGILRERERNKITSSTWFLLAVLAVFLIFPKSVGILTLFYVAVGDSVAGIVGTKWGRHRIARHVSVEGLFANITVCFLGTYFLTASGVDGFSLSGVPLLFFSLIAGVVAGLSEAVVKKIDDNLMIPMICSPTLFLMIHYFQ